MIFIIFYFAIFFSILSFFTGPESELSQHTMCSIIIFLRLQMLHTIQHKRHNIWVFLGLRRVNRLSTWEFGNLRTFQLSADEWDDLSCVSLKIQFLNFMNIHAKVHTLSSGRFRPSHTFICNDEQTREVRHWTISKMNVVIVVEDTTTKRDSMIGLRIFSNSLAHYRALFDSPREWYVLCEQISR